MSKIVFSKIMNQNIFASDYINFCENNELEFSNEGICIVYAPNGTGKTSLIKTLDKKIDTEYKLKIDDVEYSTVDNKEPFYVIQDQNNRNIISGDTSDFLMGDNIKKEHELETKINITFVKLKNDLCNEIKNTYQISSSSSKLIDLIKTPDIKSLVKDLANSKSKGSKFNIEQAINILTKIKKSEIPSSNPEKLSYFEKDLCLKSPLLEEVLNLKSSTITINNEINQVEENTEAIKLLKKFPSMHKCIVCDNDNIDPQNQIDKKETNRNRIVNLIDEKLKEMINKIIDNPFNDDVFKIKHTLLSTISTGDISLLDSLKKEIIAYKELYDFLILNSIFEIFEKCELKTIFDEYKKLIDEKPEIDQEDLLYIQGIVNDSMSKPLRLDRDKNKNIKIFLSDHEFMNVDRSELPLSSGEQNFLSLTFEFLKAKKQTDKIIVIDDPISSFDSIYKNKIVYSLVKILENRKRIILTHNLDLVRLISAQYKDCFNFYILNNVNGDSQNGFIKLTKTEQNMLTNLKELIKMFKKDIFEKINEPELYLIAMIPFMRGYCGIIGKDEEFEKLTSLMHGYKTESIDLVEIYLNLFGNSGKTTLPNKYIVNVNEILKKNFDNNLMVKDLPLLNKTLKHSATYLTLRLIVEKTLVEKYNINTDEKKQLGQIISAAFPGNDKLQVKRRVDFTSKKTLINEFNHFEGNLSIFQPAIDITESALSREKTQIMQLIDIIKNEKTLD